MNPKLSIRNKRSLDTLPMITPARNPAGRGPSAVHTGSLWPHSCKQSVVFQPHSNQIKSFCIKWLKLGVRVAVIGVALHEIHQDGGESGDVRCVLKPRCTDLSRQRGWDFTAASRFKCEFC